MSCGCPTVLHYSCHSPMCPDATTSLSSVCALKTKALPNTRPNTEMGLSHWWQPSFPFSIFLSACQPNSLIWFSSISLHLRPIFGTAFWLWHLACSFILILKTPTDYIVLTFFGPSQSWSLHLWRPSVWYDPIRFSLDPGKVPLQFPPPPKKTLIFVSQSVKKTKSGSSNIQCMFPRASLANYHKQCGL